MYNRRYDRKTIILKQETDSFSRQSVDTAVCTVEVKNGRGKIIVKGSIPQTSPVYLIANEEGGNIVVRAGSVKEAVFEADNTCGSGKKLECFDVVVVGERKDNGLFPVDVLVGYANKRREWRKNINSVAEKSQAKGGFSAARNEVHKEVYVEDIKNIGAVNENGKNEDISVADIRGNIAPEPISGIPEDVPKEKIVVWEVKGEQQEEKPIISDGTDKIHEHAPHEHAPHEHAPHEYAPHEHAPHEHAPHEHAPHEHAPHEHAPHEHAPQEPVSQESVIQQSVLQNSLSSQEEESQGEEEEDDIHDTFKRIVKNFNKQMQTLESMGVLSLSEILAINGKGEQSAEEAVCEKEEQAEKEEVETEAVMEKYQEDKSPDEKGRKTLDEKWFCSEIDYMFENNPPMEPFENDSCQWVRVCPEELWLLPGKDTFVNNSSFVICADKKYKHLILGRQGGRLLLGVPQAFNPKDRKQASSLGFIDFWQNKGQNAEEGGYGYWIRKMD